MCSTHNAAVILYLSLLVIASPAFAQDPALMENGNHPEETYDGIRENVNLATGNVNLSLTLLKLPGRNGLDYLLPMNYNSSSIAWYTPFPTDATLKPAGPYAPRAPVLRTSTPVPCNTHGEHGGIVSVS